MDKLDNLTKENESLKEKLLNIQREEKPDKTKRQSSNVKEKKARKFDFSRYVGILLPAVEKSSHTLKSDINGLNQDSLLTCFLAQEGIHPTLLCAYQILIGIIKDILL